MSGPIANAQSTAAFSQIGDNERVIVKDGNRPQGKGNDIIKSGHKKESMAAIHLCREAMTKDFGAHASLVAYDELSLTLNDPKVLSKGIEGHHLTRLIGKGREIFEKNNEMIGEYLDKVKVKNRNDPSRITAQFANNIAEYLRKAEPRTPVIAQVKNEKNGKTHDVLVLGRVSNQITDPTYNLYYVLDPMQPTIYQRVNIGAPEFVRDRLTYNENSKFTGQYMLHYTSTSAEETPTNAQIVDIKDLAPARKTNEDITFNTIRQETGKYLAVNSKGHLEAKDRPKKVYQTTLEENRKVAELIKRYINSCARMDTNLRSETTVDLSRYTSNNNPERIPISMLNTILDDVGIKIF